MKMNEIELLAKEWADMVKLLWNCEFIDLEEIKDLSQRTYVYMREYSNKEFVPKEMCSLIMEMYGFAWWIADSEASPMHGLYPELVDIIESLTSLFYGDEDCLDIEPLLDKL